MNLTTMAHIRDGYIVDIPPVSKNLPPNPLLGYNGPRTAPPSLDGSSSSVTQSTLAHRVLLKDQRCLITGAVSTQLQACHLINTIRMNVCNRAEKLPLKQEVVRSVIFNTLGNSKASRLGTDPHSTTVWWSCRLFLGQPTKLYCQ